MSEHVIWKSIHISKCFYFKARKHSSRMHTTHLPTIHASVATRGQYWWQEGPCTVRSSEQVWTDLQWWPPDVTSRGPWSGQVPMSGRRAGPGPGQSCTVRSHAPWIMVTWGPPPPLSGLTDTTENITFPQHLWQATMKIIFPFSKVSRMESEP